RVILTRPLTGCPDGSTTRPTMLPTPEPVLDTGGGTGVSPCARTAAAHIRIAIRDSPASTSFDPSRIVQHPFWRCEPKLSRRVVERCVETIDHFSGDKCHVAIGVSKSDLSRRTERHAFYRIWPVCAHLLGRPVI